VKNLVVHRFKNHSDFLALRRKMTGAGQKDVFRLGASDIASVYNNGEQIGLNEWVSPTRFFYESCEYVKKEPYNSLEMLRGHIQESIIKSEYWVYINPDWDENEMKNLYLDNYYGEKKVYRKAVKANQIIENKDYPWLFITPDYHISKNELTSSGPLELKSPSSRTCDKYESGVATQYLIQLQGQMLLWQKEYGELFQVVDATWPGLFKFNKNEKIQEQIVLSTKDFVDRVLKGKKIVYSRRSATYKEQALGELAPPDDGHPLYTKFLKERHRPENTKLSLEGDDNQLENVLKLLKVKEKQERLDRSKVKLENKVREYFSPGVGEINFPGLGSVKWIEKFVVDKKILKNY